MMLTGDEEHVTFPATANDETQIANIAAGTQVITGCAAALL